LGREPVPLVAWKGLRDFVQVEGEFVSFLPNDKFPKRLHVGPRGAKRVTKIVPVVSGA